MTDYTELVNALRCKRDDCEGCDLAFFDKDEGWMCQYAAKDNDAADAIEALQAELIRICKQLPKRGEWVYNDGDYIPYCSICGMPQDTETPYCHFCGAKMREVQE